MIRPQALNASAEARKKPPTACSDTGAFSCDMRTDMTSAGGIQLGSGAGVLSVLAGSSGLAMYALGNSPVRDLRKDAMEATSALVSVLPS